MSAHGSSIEYFIFGGASADIFHIVYRVHWLKAKARMDRANEELILVKDEMRWTVASFRHHSLKWQERLNNSLMLSRLGHAAYASRQKWMWDEFTLRAMDAFGQVVQC